MDEGLRFYRITVYGGKYVVYDGWTTAALAEDRLYDYRKIYPDAVLELIDDPEGDTSAARPMPEATR